MKKKRIIIGSEKQDYSKYFVWAIVFLLLFLTYMIIRPFIIAIISAFILAYLVRPLYNKIKKKNNKKLSALICIVLVSIIILLPIATIAAGLMSQAEYLKHNNPLEEIPQNEFLENLGIDVDSISKDAMNYISRLVDSSIDYLPSMFLSVIIILFGMYYILIDWDLLVEKLKSFIPFKNKERIIKEVSINTQSIVYGTLFIALLEFVVSMLAFYLLGIRTYILLPSMIFFLAFIPGLGPVIVWLPMALYYFIIGDWFTFTGVLLTGAILSLGIDAGLRAKIIGGKLKMNPFIMLIGILGGIALFGVFGFIIGPLVIIYTLEILDALKTG